MVLDVGVNLIDGPVGLTFGHSVDEVVLHELVALDDPPGFFRRHHRGPKPSDGTTLDIDDVSSLCVYYSLAVMLHSKHNYIIIT